MKYTAERDDNSSSSSRGHSSIPRSHDDSAIAYVFQRQDEFPQFTNKPSQRWGSGDDGTVIDNSDSWKYNTNVMIGNSNNTISNNGGNCDSIVGNNNNNGGMSGMSMQTNSSLKGPAQMISHPPHQLQAHINHALMNHTLNAGNPSGNIQMQMTIQGSGMYDHIHPNGMPKTSLGEQLVYCPQNLNVMQQAPFMSTRNAISSSAKKVWEKTPADIKMSSGGGQLTTPLQIQGQQSDPFFLRDPTWSTQTDPIHGRNVYQHQQNSSNSCGNILSPRDTGGLGVKMVEYVLGGSPTNKDSPLSSLVPRMGNLKFDENDKQSEDKDKENSPFDAHGMKKDDQTNPTNGVVNGIDDDKGFNRTPGSRQPSPSEENLARPTTLLDPTTHPFHQQHIQHILNMSAGMEQHHSNTLNSYHPQLMNHQIQMNGIQVQNQMVQQQQQANQLDSSANLLQPHNIDIQQLFRSQNQQIPTNGGQPNGQPPQLPQTLQLPQQQYLAQQNAAYAAATQQGQPYVINPGQEATPYMGLIAAGVPQYYNVPWSVYPANLIAQQNAQPRRPLTPSQQPNDQQYQVISYYDQNGSLMMGPRTGTPMRLVSPAPVMVQPGTQRAPPTQQMYSQQATAQQNLYPTQNGSSVAGLPLNTQTLSARRDSFDRNTSAFSPSLQEYVGSAANLNARKWPLGNYGTLGPVTTSGSPLGTSSLTPPPSSLMQNGPSVLGALVSNRAPGAESKFRAINQLAPVGLSQTNAIFGSNNSIFSKLPTSMQPITTRTRPQSSVLPGSTNCMVGSGGGNVCGAGGISVGSNTGMVTTSTPGNTTPVDQRPATGRSRLLEDFRNQRFPNLQLRELTNHIVEFSQDQHGSRFIQQKLERATSTEKQLVFSEIVNHAYNLMTDVFGNYVIQKFFEYGTPEQKATLATQVKGHVLPLALQMYGCRVIQKALESIPSEQQQEIVRELDGHVLKCVKDQNGNHVVQKCIECVEPVALQFIINAFAGQVCSLSTHPYGCRVIQRILEHCTAEQTQPILNELHAHTESLIQDQYGNYVIQHVLEHGKPDDKSVLIGSVKGKVLILSQHKFASNVVEKCVTHATRQERANLIEEVCNFTDNALHLMMKDQYANYVVQKMIDVSEPTQRKILMHKIRPHMNSLRKYTYGKHIIAKLEKFFTKSSNSTVSASAVSVTNNNNNNNNNNTNNNNAGMNNVSVNGTIGNGTTSSLLSSSSVSSQQTQTTSTGMNTDSLGPICPPPSTNNGVM